MSVQHVDGTALYYGDINQSPDKGVVKYGGNISSSRWTSRSLARNEVSSNYLIKFGLNTDKALSAGVFAYMAAEHYIIRRVTTTLATVSNTVLLSGGGPHLHNGLHPNEHVRATILKGLSWAATADLPIYTSTLTDYETTFSQDDAARPTLAVPGELVYQTGDTGNPKMADYESRTNG